VHYKEKIAYFCITNYMLKRCIRRRDCRQY